MAPPISSRFALLQALAMGPGYGLVLIERVAEATAGHIILNTSGVYTMLRGMEETGLIRGHAGPGSPHGGKPRRWYELTEQGREEYKRAKEAIEELGTRSEKRQKKGT